MGTSPATTAGYERRLSRLLTAFIGSGLLFLLGSGSLLGLWNLLAISHARAAAAMTPAWLQAHAHAEVYGWVGSFILGIGFHSLSRTRGTRVPLPAGWCCWGLWTIAVALRWSSAIYAWHWRVLLPASAALEIAAFLLFQRCVFRAHRMPAGEGEARPAWVMLVMVGACGFLLTLLLNLGFDIFLSGWSATPAYPPPLDQRLVGLMAWAFLAPFVFGFSLRWLPIFAGLCPAWPATARVVAFLIGFGIVATLAGASVAAAACWLAAAAVAIAGLRVWQRSRQAAKTQGIHASFPFFIRLAYGWLALAALLGLWGAAMPRLPGVGGAGRHAFTVGFIAGMILTIGPRILPAFAGMRVLHSPALMALSLVLLHTGCGLRVSGEVLAYAGWLPLAWRWLPFSAALEVLAFALFAYNMVRTLLRPPAHQLHRMAAPLTIGRA